SLALVAFTTSSGGVTAKAAVATSAPTRPIQILRIRCSCCINRSRLKALLRRRFRRGIPGGGTALLARVLLARRHVGHELADEVLEHERRLRELDLVAVLQRFVVAAGGQAEV